MSLCIYTNHSKELIRDFNNREKMAEVFWISHGMTVYYLATEWLCFIVSNIDKKK